MPEAPPPPPDIPEGLEHLLPQFVAEMAKDAAILTGLAGAPLDALAEHAHAMRGKAAMFGEGILYGLLSRMEELALAGQPQRLPALSAQVVERANQLAVYGVLAAADVP